MAEKCLKCQKFIIRNQKKQICPKCNSIFHSACLKFEDEEIHEIAGEFLLQSYWLCLKCNFKVVLSKQKKQIEFKIGTKLVKWFSGLCIFLVVFILLISLFF